MIFKKQLDSVWSIGLWEKLLRYNVRGKILNFIKSMYCKIKSCVELNGNQSNFFDYKAGQIQVENPSPVLFSLFLNDLQFYLSKNPKVGLDIYDQNFNSFLRIIV